MWPYLASPVGNKGATESKTSAAFLFLARSVAAQGHVMIKMGRGLQRGADPQARTIQKGTVGVGIGQGPRMSDAQRQRHLDTSGCPGDTWALGGE